VNRREFIALGGAATLPFIARAQERIHRVGVHMTSVPTDKQNQARLAAFLDGLKQLGWVDGRNVKLDILWGGVADPERNRMNATELLALSPDVILGTTTPSMAALQRATRTVPIVFAMVVDPVGSGVVETLAQPGGNVTGFMQFEYSLAGKWLDLLKEIAPGLRRAAVLRDPANASGIGQFAVIQAMAPSLGIEVRAINMRDASEIERTIATFANAPNGGLVVTGGQATSYRDLIFKLALSHRLPAVYPYSYYAHDGGLISYGPNLPGLFRQAAGYVDRILKGEKPSNLPVQAPTKYELVINLKTAKSLGLTVPPTLLARADEVIE
jgi:putative ABC transport system substrate-binding protein